MPPLVARVTNVLVKGGERLTGDPVCWAEVLSVNNGTYIVNTIRFKTNGTFTLNQAFDEFELLPFEDAPAHIQTFLKRRWANR